LLTLKGQEALNAAEALAPREEDFLPCFQRLRQRYADDLARAALEIAILRAQARRKFPFAQKLYFTREALEQASSWEVSQHRAKRYQGASLVLDLACSVGGDTFALAAVAPTIGVDLDALRLAMAQANLEALNLKASLIQADLGRSLPLSTPSAALFFDPARRAGHRRLFSVYAYQPSLMVIDEWLRRFPALGVKLSPGVNLDELGAYQAEIEFISLSGELKEAALWFGALRSAWRRATLLPEGHTLAATESDTRQRPLLALSEPRQFIYEPDPAILRAGLVAELGAQLEAAQLDPDIAYLTADTFRPTPFARAWAVEAWMPFGLKRLRAYLRARGVGKITVKKRGSPLQPQALIQQLRLNGEEQRVLFLTHLRGKAIVIIARPLQERSD
jgi:SAM-dependent methyltransferase